MIEFIILEGLVIIGILYFNWNLLKYIEKIEKKIDRLERRQWNTQYNQSKK